MYQGSIKEIIDKAKARQIAVKEFNAHHIRLYGKLEVDYWPSKKRAWIVHSNKSFKVDSIENLFDVAMKLKWPEDVKVRGVMKAGEVAKLFDPNEVCMCCAKFIKQRKAVENSP